MINKTDYLLLNNTFKHALTYSFENLGFYSNFNNMILTMAFCLKNRLRFRVFCKDNDLFAPKGWETLFLPMEFETKNPFFAHFNFRKKLFLGSGLNEWIHMAVNSLYPLLTGNNLVNAAYPDNRTFWFLKEHFEIPELGFSGGLRELCRELVKVTYVFNDEIQSRIDSYVNSIELPEHNVSLHIRRGDKDTERELLPVNLYIEHASHHSDIRDAFVLTDDYTVIEELRATYPDWQFYTLTQPTERGYNYKADKGGQRESWLKLFAAIELMSKSDLFVGTVSTNPGMFLGMVMPPEHVEYLDSQEWILL